jgi:hypothetical protein
VVSDSSADGFADPFADAARELDRRIAEHELMRSGDQYTSELTFTWRLTMDFARAVHAVALAFTRYPESNKWLLSATADDVIESSIAIASLARDGVFGAGRRELRYVLEAVVKAVYCDQVLPGDAVLQDRISWTSDSNNVPRSSVDVIDRVTLRMVPDPADYRDAVRSLFGSLSGYTHVSRPQMEERLRRVGRGEYIGFEQPRTLRAFNAVLRNAYDAVLALVFEGFGPSFTGDVFVQILDDERSWKFHRSRYVSGVSAHFDYKHERKTRREDDDF